MKWEGVTRRRRKKENAINGGCEMERVSEGRRQNSILSCVSTIADQPSRPHWAVGLTIYPWCSALCAHTHARTHARTDAPAHQLTCASAHHAQTHLHTCRPMCTCADMHAQYTHRYTGTQTRERRMAAPIHMHGCPLHFLFIEQRRLAPSHALSTHLLSLIFRVVWHRSPLWTSGSVNSYR